MRTIRLAFMAALVLVDLSTLCWGGDVILLVPRLVRPPVIDGDLSEWRDRAFSDGVWTMDRLRQTPWYDPERCRLTVEPGEKPGQVDLAAAYYIAWDQDYLYLGAEAWDNVHDVTDPAPEDKRWYYKDAVCWFVEAPRDTWSEQFGRGDNAFCFVMDTTYPWYGAWWRHGTATQTYVEEPLPPGSVDYRITMDPWGRSPADFVLEARVRMRDTFAVSDPSWRPPQVKGDTARLRHGATAAPAR